MQNPCHIIFPHSNMEKHELLMNDFPLQTVLVAIAMFVCQRIKYAKLIINQVSSGVPFGPAKQASNST